MEWIIIISIVSNFIIACMSIYLSYRARTLPYREKLYSRQLEGYFGIN